MPIRSILGSSVRDAPPGAPNTVFATRTECASCDEPGVDAPATMREEVAECRYEVAVDAVTNSLKMPVWLSWVKGCPAHRDANGRRERRVGVGFARPLAASNQPDDRADRPPGRGRTPATAADESLPDVRHDALVLVLGATSTG